MSIFSLQTKKHLVGWSVVLAFVINILFVSQLRIYTPGRSLGPPESHIYPIGWPFKYIWDGLSIDQLFIDQNFILDFIFWIGVVLIILSLIRYFKNHKIIKS